MDLTDNIFKNVKQNLNHYFDMGDESFNINKTTKFYKCFQPNLKDVINDHSNKNNFHIISLNQNSKFCMDLYNVFPRDQEFSVTEMNNMLNSFEKQYQDDVTYNEQIIANDDINRENEYLSFYDNVSNRIYDNVSNKIIVMQNDRNEPIVFIEKIISPGL